MTNLNNARVIAGASPIELWTSYTPLRNLLVSDAANEADNGIVNYLPMDNQFSAFLPTGITKTGYLAATKANLKALGATNLDGLFGINDGVINFNSGFAFDYDASNGITSGTMDFETVAAHEIGHILGFMSIVDRIDYMLANNQTGAVTPYLLDLFRFGTSANPTTTADFSTMSRELRPTVASYFDDLSIQVPFSTGAFTGDSYQASHWKETGSNLWGIMDPAIAYSQIAGISKYDLRAMDLIGYEVTAVPLPPAIWLFAGGLLAWTRYARRSLLNTH
jgi:hypothetical protein